MARKPKPSGRRLSHKGRPLQGRAVNTRSLRPKFLIVCEGGKTEPNYFQKFRVAITVIKLVIEGLGDNTLSLVKRTCDLKQQDEYTQVWCVFDRDSFPAEQFNAAIDLARRNDIQVAYSNEAFEIWYLLHFDYHDTAISRDLYQQKLTEKLGRPYRKNDLNMYSELLEKQVVAIRNAQTLLESYGDRHNPERDNPCTTVHTLVQELNRYIR